MSYPSSVKLFCKFEDSLLLNETSMGTAFSPTPTGSQEVVAGQYGNGTQLHLDSYLTSAVSLSITSQFSIGFWLKPKCPGAAATPSGALTALKQSLMGVADFATAGDTVTITNASFDVYEETGSGNVNRLCVFLNGGTVATARTSSYAADVWHHFWVVYNGPLSAVTVYVDGKASPLTVSGTVPTTLNASTAGFFVNKGVQGHTYDTARNIGVLDELVILNTVDVAVVDRVINLGVEYAYESTHTTTYEAYQAFVFDDPATVQVNDVFSDNANVYVAKSDGTLSRGTNVNWQVNHGFGAASEQALLQSQFGVDNSKYTMNQGALTIKTIVVRL